MKHKTRMLNSLKLMSDDELFEAMCFNRNMAIYFRRMLGGQMSDDKRDMVRSEYKYWKHYWNMALAEVRERG